MRGVPPASKPLDYYERLAGAYPMTVERMVGEIARMLSMDTWTTRAMLVARFIISTGPIRILRSMHFQDDTPHSGRLIFQARIDLDRRNMPHDWLGPQQERLAVIAVVDGRIARPPWLSHSDVNALWCFNAMHGRYNSAKVRLDRLPPWEHDGTIPITDLVLEADDGPQTKSADAARAPAALGSDGTG